MGKEWFTLSELRMSGVEYFTWERLRQLAAGFATLPKRLARAAGMEAEFHAANFPEDVVAQLRNAFAVYERVEIVAQIKRPGIWRNYEAPVSEAELAALGERIARRNRERAPA